MPALLDCTWVEWVGSSTVSQSCWKAQPRACCYRYFLRNAGTLGKLSDDVFFSGLMSPTEAETAKGITKEGNEKSVVKWMVRFCLIVPGTLEEWVKMSSSRHSREDDPAADFSDAYPQLHVRFGYTIDLLCQTDYICETSNSLLHELVQLGASFASQDATMDYFLNELRPINDICRWVGTTAEKVAVRRRNGEHVRLRATDNHAKRQLQVSHVAELTKRYTPELMAMVPTLAEITKAGTKSYNSKQIYEVLKASKEKKGRHTLEPFAVETIMKSFQDTEIEVQASLNCPDETAHEAALGLLITPGFWATVSTEQIQEEIRWTLPHAHSMLVARDGFELPEIKSSFGPPLPVSLWTEPADGAPPTPPGGWCLPTCTKRQDDSGRWIYCEWELCKGRCFHFSCVGIKRKPKGTWFCSTCALQAKARPAWHDDEVSGARKRPRLTPSVIWSKSDKHTKTTADRQNKPCFIKKQIKGYVDLFFGGRSTQMVGLKGSGDFHPEKECPACKCRHAGGIRCYLSAEEDDIFLSVFVRPFGETLMAALRSKKVAKEGEALGLDGESDLSGDESESMVLFTPRSSRASPRTTRCNVKY
mmetsp:Transcript_3505/g.7469  ORF Transcript_3505/g.7469 Transcript_3505/m.7469 type:complete len:589 (+) Transcript_3505:432-2198(+)